MLAMIPMQWTRRVAAAAVVGGVLSLGSAGVAGAATAPPTTTVGGTTGPTTGHFSCERAPIAMNRLTKADSLAARRLPKMQSAEKKATAAGHKAVAGRIERRIHRLQRITTRIGRLEHRIKTKCASSSPGTGSNST